MASLELQNLNLSIANKHVCNNLSLQFDAGQRWGILGRNGVGKTTLLHTLCQLRQRYSGKILLNDEDISLLKRKVIAQQIGIQLQHIEDPFPATVLQTVLDGRHPFISNWQWESQHDIDKANAALDIVGLSELSDREVNQLSGGERQRVSLATLITQDPSILLLDEPNSHLDLNYQVKLLDYFVNYAENHQRILIMNLHDINLAKRYCTHILLLAGNGQFHHGEADHILTDENLTDTFNHPIKSIITDNHSLFYPG